MINFVVAAHPARAGRARDLAAELGAVIVWDTTGRVADTTGRALSVHAAAASHVVVIQDDAVLSAGAVESIEAACAAAGSRRPVGLYLGRRDPSCSWARAVERATAAGAPWVEAWGPAWGVAAAHPVALLPRVLPHYWSLRHVRPDDTRLTRCYTRIGVRCWYTIPSLVDHDDTVPSITKPGHENRGRVAHRFGPGVDIDWSIPPVRKGSR